MMKQRLDSLEAALRELLSDVRICGTVDDFYGTEESYCGLWMTGEDGNTLASGMPAFCYGAEGGPAYDFGVHEDVGSLLGRHNAHAEWNDPGTVMVYLD